MPDPQAGAVLIVDADSAERSAIRTMLAPLGHHTAEADSEHSALDAIGRESFSNILLDVSRRCLLPALL